MSETKIIEMKITADGARTIENMLRDSVDRYEKAIKRANEMIDQFDEGELGSDMLWDDLKLVIEGLTMMVNEYEDRIDDLEKGIAEAQKVRLAAEG